MKTITLTDDQFDTLFGFVNQKVESIIDTSVDYNDSEILNEWEVLFDVHTVLETADNWSWLMAINTLHKVTLTEGQIGVILCSLEKSVKSELWFKDSDSDYISEIDGIFEILEGTIDRYYDKVEKAQAKQPTGEW